MFNQLDKQKIGKIVFYLKGDMVMTIMTKLNTFEEGENGLLRIMSKTNEINARFPFRNIKTIEYLGVNTY